VFRKSRHVVLMVISGTMFTGATCGITEPNPATQPTPLEPLYQPNAVISGLPGSVVSPVDRVFLDGDSSFDLDGVIINYQWSLDGIPQSNDPWFFLPQLPAGKSVTVGLSVEDDSGLFGSTEHRIDCMGPRGGKWEGTIAGGVPITFTVVGSNFYAVNPSLGDPDCRVANLNVSQHCYATPRPGQPSTCQVVCEKVESIYAHFLWFKVFEHSLKMGVNVTGITATGSYTVVLNFGGESDSTIASGEVLIESLNSSPCNGIGFGRATLAAHWVAP